MCRSVGVWECRCVGVYVCGSVCVWECMCVGVCVCGSVGVWECPGTNTQQYCRNCQCARWGLGDGIDGGDDWRYQIAGSDRVLAYPPQCD